MPTAAELAFFTDKKLMGFEDFGTRLLRYLQNDIRQSVKRLFVQGSFGERMPLSSPGVNQVQVDLKPILGDGFAHDGSGRLLDLEQISRVAQFENVTGTTYEVGAGYVEYPADIRINPRTGKPEYDRLIEGIGVEAQPDSVTNNGANMTFRVDSLFEQGVAMPTHAGRLVRVFKKVPSDDAALASEAIETATVFFAGGQNQITTTGVFAQSTVSTDPADYTVQLVGIIVLKDTATNRPTQNPETNFFVGTVDGDTGNPPSSFDISAQVIIEAQGAAGITFSPYTGAGPISWEIAAVDVQNAIEEIVDDLTALPGGAPDAGAQLIRVDPSGYAQSNPSASLAWGGLDTGSGDSAWDSLVRADRQLARSRFGITHADTGSMEADFHLMNGLSSFPNETHWLKGTGLFRFLSDSLDPDGYPTIAGEGPLKTSILTTTGSGIKRIFGKFENLAFGLGTSSTYAVLGGDTTSRGAFEARNCRISPNAFYLGAGTRLVDTPDGAFDHYQPHAMHGCYVLPDPIAGSPQPLFDNFVSDNDEGAGPKMVSNCTFDADLGHALYQDGNPEADDEACPTLYANCVFISRNGGGGNALLINSNNVTFLNCAFIHLRTGDGSTCVSANVPGYGEGNVFEGCYFYSLEGRVYSSSTTSSKRATFRNCVFRSHPTNVPGAGYSFGHFMNGNGETFEDCDFIIGGSSIDDSGTNPAFVFPAANVRDCRIQFDTTKIPRATPIQFGDQSGNTDVRINGLSIALPGNDPVGTNGISSAGDTGQPAWIEITGSNAIARPIVRNLRITGTAVVAEADVDMAHSIVALEECVVDGLDLQFSYTNSTASFIGFEGIVWMERNAVLRNVWIDFGSNNDEPQVATNFAYFMINGEGAVLQDVDLQQGNEWNANSGDTVFVRVNNSNVTIDGVRMRNTPGFVGSFVFCVGGGDRITVRNCLLITGSAGLAGDFYVRNAVGPNSTSWMVVNNTFIRKSGAADINGDSWIDLSVIGGGEYSMIDGNILVTTGATLPTPQNGTSGVTGDNVAVNNSVGT